MAVLGYGPQRSSLIQAAWSARRAHTLAGDVRLSVVIEIGLLSVINADRALARVGESIILGSFSVGSADLSLP